MVGIQESFAEQASGKPSWETNSEKVCGDKLCSEVQDLVSIEMRVTNTINELGSFQTIHIPLTINSNVKNVSYTDSQFIFGIILIREGLHFANINSSIHAKNNDLISLTIPNEFFYDDFELFIDNHRIEYSVEKLDMTTHLIFQLPISDSSVHSPKKQLSEGIQLEEIICKKGFVLISKSSDDSPACVTSLTAEKLIERGWDRLSSKNNNVITIVDNNKTKNLSDKNGYVIKVIKNITDTPVHNLDTTSLKEAVNELQNYYLVSPKKFKLQMFLDNTGIIKFVEGPFPNWHTIKEGDIVDHPQYHSTNVIPPLERSPAPTQFARDISTTNIQVQNVDESDFVKNDSKFIYTLSNGKLFIVDAFPPQQAKIVSTVELDSENYTFHDMLLSVDTVVIFSSQIDPYHTQKIKVIMLDVKDRENPVITKTFSVTGEFNESRLIDDTVYLITKSSNHYIDSIPTLETELGKTSIPDIYYFPDNVRYGFDYYFNTVTAFDITNVNPTSISFVLGNGDTIYISKNNIFISFSNHNYSTSVLSDQFFSTFFEILKVHLDEEAQIKISLLLNNLANQNEDYSNIATNEVYEILLDTIEKLDRGQRDIIQSKLNKEQHPKLQLVESYGKRHTIVQKISINGITMMPVGAFSVPGTVLNQFSMDEYDEKFRIITSVGWNLGTNVYVIDDEFNQVGTLENIAPGERIYSSRFMGDQLYLVTYLQMYRIDPFFVIDLSETQPKILGELKIPGFSDYLHPYGKDHVIGIGRDAQEDSWSGFQSGGVKITMFDVSDLNNPLEVYSVIIGDGATNSEVLDDHKAILIDEKKSMISIPIYDRTQGGLFFSVFGITDSKKINEMGKIEHEKIYYHDPKARSLYMDEYLYTITSQMIKINEIDNDDISKNINQIELKQN